MTTPFKPVKRKLVAEINVVPYIDVMLVLLIIFMVTAPLLMQGVEVNLPEATSTPIDPDQDEPIIVSLKADGSFYIDLAGDSETARPLSEIQGLITKVLAQKPTTPVMVWGDEAVPYGDVISLMSALQRAGATTVGLVTEPLSEI